MTRLLPLSALAFAASALLLASCSGSHADDTQPRAASSAGLPKGRLAAGEQAANLKSRATGQTCLDCHGADGNQPLDSSYPRIGGQYRDYLAHALTQYRSGARDHILMSQQAQDLTDQQIADLAVYFSSRPSQLTDLYRAY